MNSPSLQLISYKINISYGFSHIKYIHLYTMILKYT